MAERRYNPIRRLRIKKTDDLKAIYAKVKRSFTAADLQQYTVNEEGVPADQVVAELHALAKIVPRKRKKK
jgi:hypothetical protein